MKRKQNEGSICAPRKKVQEREECSLIDEHKLTGQLQSIVCALLAQVCVNVEYWHGDR